MGPLLPPLPSLARDGAANGHLDRGPSGPMLQAIHRQTPFAGSVSIRYPPESDSLDRHIDIDIQAGGNHGVNNAVMDSKKGLEGRGEGSGSDVTASTTSIPHRDIDIDGTSDGGSSSDEASSDSSLVSEEYYDSEDDDDRATTSTSSAISSVSSLQSPSSSFSSFSEDSTASSRRNHRPTGDASNQIERRGEAGTEDGAALVLIGCRMCLTYYMVCKPADACPRCGDQGNHIVRFGG